MTHYIYLVLKTAQLVMTYVLVMYVLLLSGLLICGWSAYGLFQYYISPCYSYENGVFKGEDCQNKMGAQIAIPYIFTSVFNLATSKAI